jgi:hypothetical protein
MARHIAREVIPANDTDMRISNRWAPSTSARRKRSIA